MPYNDIISNSQAAALIPQEVSDEITKAVRAKNPLLQMARKLPNMSTNQQKMPVMSALATAYFVTGRTGLKQTTSVSWENKYIDAEEIAAIVPVSMSAMEDSKYDIWGEAKEALEDAFVELIAGAVLFGTSIPASWTTNLGAAGLVAGATAASQAISLAGYTDIYEAILGEKADGTKGLFGLVEEDGFAVTGSIAHLSMKGKLRNARDMNGQPIFKSTMQAPTAYELDGTPIQFPNDASFDVSQALQIAGQWDQLVYSMRQDMTFTLGKEAVIQDGSGTIVYNLFQQDMVALRAVMRLGFALPNPINRTNQTAATRFPFGVLTA